MNPTVYSRRFDGFDIASNISVNVVEGGKLRLSGCVTSWEMLITDAKLYNQLLDKKEALEDQAK